MEKYLSEVFNKFDDGKISDSKFKYAADFCKSYLETFDTFEKLKADIAGKNKQLSELSEQIQKLKSVENFDGVQIKKLQGQYAAAADEYINFVTLKKNMEEMLEINLKCLLTQFGISGKGESQPDGSGFGMGQ